MRSLSAVSLLSGPLVLAGYLIGAATVTWLRRGHARPTPSDHLVEAFVALATSTVAWRLIQEVSPGSNLSRVAYYSNQVFSAWQSVALWVGLAVVAGCAAPIFRRFSGSTGIGPAAALLVVHFPWVFFGALAAGGTSFALARDTRQTELAVIVVILPLAWLGWLLEWLPAWGLTTGPEATIWTMVLALILGVRWWTTGSASRDIATE